MMNWYCIYTKPKMEEAVSGQLLNLPDIEVFQPKLKRSGLRRGKLQEKTEHLFPCYLFSRFTPSRYYHLITYTRGVKRIISDPSGHPCIVDDQIIAQIRSRLQDGYIHLEPAIFNPGDRVMIQEGPLAGFTGIFQQLKAQDRVLMLLNIINYQARIEVARQNITKL
ncbi:MAG: transcription termination/antitermination NusG family protein [Smithella sp.]